MKSISTLSLLIVSSWVSFGSAFVNPKLEHCMTANQNNISELHNCLHHAFSNDDAHFVLAKVQELQISKSKYRREKSRADFFFIENACNRARDINPRVDFSKYGLKKPGQYDKFVSPFLLTLYQSGQHEKLSAKFGGCVKGMEADYILLTMKYCLPLVKSQNDAVYLILWNILSHPYLSSVISGGHSEIQDVVDKSIRAIYTIGDKRVWQLASKAGLNNPL